MIKARLKGIKSLKKKLKALPDNLQQPIRVEIKKGARDVEADAKAEVPFGTGNLRDHITHRITQKGFKAEVGIRGLGGQHKAFYALSVHFGTGPRFTKSGAGRGSVPGNPFLSRAFNKNRRSILKGIKGAVHTAVKKGRLR